MNWSFASSFITLVIQPRVSTCWLWASTCLISSCSRTQVHLDILQSSRECLHESTSPQIPQSFFGAMFLLWRMSPVGIEWRANLQRNIRILGGNLALQRSTHPFSSDLASDLPAMWSNQAVVVAVTCGWEKSSPWLVYVLARSVLGEAWAIITLDSYGLIFRPT
jgi:hypothetical protein